MSYGIYWLATGEIDFMTYDGEEQDALRQVSEGQGVILMSEGTNSTHRVDVSVVPHVLIERPPTPSEFSLTTLPADGHTVTTLSGLPDDTWVEVESGPDRIGNTVSGDLELDFVHPGTYRVFLSAPFPYRRSEVTINAT
tara:strand:- start:658 stop:1074 length:417 start_codon:yes stop_codon:yes gene_type:complete